MISYGFTVNDSLFVYSMQGGELFGRIQKRRDCPFTERGMLEKYIQTMHCYC